MSIGARAQSRRVQSPENGRPQVKPKVASAPKLSTSLTVHVPFTLHLRGGRKTVISPVPLSATAFSKPRFDNALIKALARAHRWRRMIEQGTYASITDLAKAEGVNQSYACRLLRLTLLSPAIVEAILDGRQSDSLQLAHFLKPFPVLWNEQAKQLAVQNH